MTTFFCDPGMQADIEAAVGTFQIRTFAETLEQAARQARSLEAGEEAWLFYPLVDAAAGCHQVKDHINLSFENPLFGNREEPRFPDMTAVYQWDAGDAVVAVLGTYPGLDTWPETTARISAGIWDAIALRHRGHALRAWTLTGARDIRTILSSGIQIS